MPFTFDEEDVIKGGQQIQRPGKYNVEITNADAKDSKSSGNLMLQVDYKVLDGVEEGNTIKYDTYANVEDSDSFGLKRLNTLVKSIGGVSNGTSMDWEQLAKALVGKRVNIAVDVEPNTYNGETRLKTRVKWSEPVNPEGSTSGDIVVLPKEETIDLVDKDLPF